MKVLGNILLFLGIVALLAGIGLVIISALEVQPLAEEFYQHKEEIEAETEPFREVLSDAELLRQRALTLIDDYKAGEIRDPGDRRVRKFLSDARDLASRSQDLRDDVEEHIDSILEIVDRLEKRSIDLARLGGAGGILMVLSGWIFVLGMLCLRQK